MTDKIDLINFVFKTKVGTPSVNLMYKNSSMYTGHFELGMKGLLKVIKEDGDELIRVSPQFIEYKRRIIPFINKVCTECGYKVINYEEHHVDLGEKGYDDFTFSLVRVRSPMLSTVSKMSSQKMSKMRVK